MPDTISLCDALGLCQSDPVTKLPFLPFNGTLSFLTRTLAYPESEDRSGRHVPSEDTEEALERTTRTRSHTSRRAPHKSPCRPRVYDSHDSIVPVCPRLFVESRPWDPRVPEKSRLQGYRRTVVTGIYFPNRPALDVHEFRQSSRRRWLKL